MVKNPLANAGDTGSIPGSRKMPHALGQLSLCATTEPEFCKKRSHCNEKSTHHNWREVPAPYERVTGRKARQEGQGGNRLQASDIFSLSLKQQEETN